MLRRSGLVATTNLCWVSVAAVNDVPTRLAEPLCMATVHRASGFDSRAWCATSLHPGALGLSMLVATYFPDCRGLRRRHTALFGDTADTGIRTSACPQVCAAVVVATSPNPLDDCKSPDASPVKARDEFSFVAS